MKYILAHMKEKKRLTKCERVCAVRRKITIPKKNPFRCVGNLSKRAEKNGIYGELKDKYDCMAV